MVRQRRGSDRQNRWWGLISGLCVAVGMLPISLQAAPAVSAERVSFQAGPLKRSLPIDALETFAKTGKIEPDLQFYARLAGKDAMAQLRTILNRRFKLSPVVISRLSYSPLGEDAIRQLGDLIRTSSGQNGFYALRASWLLASANPDGFTLLDLMKQFPSRDIVINASELLSVQRLLTAISGYTDAAVAAIGEEAQREAAANPFVNPKLPDPRQPGSYKVTKRTLNLERKTQNLEGGSTIRRFYVDVYLPEGKAQPSSVVVVSHGLGSSPAAFAYLGEHLASHGFVAVLPEHIGSGAQRREDLFNGLTSSGVSLTEFVERPLDVKQALDILEERANTEFAGKLNMQKVGIIGHSFGGYTALVLAGATFNLPRLFKVCPTALRFNSSIALQCLNQRLPNFDVSVLKDPRIKAAIAMNPVTSLVFGPEGMATINVPTMLVGGSNDLIAPLVLEQVHPFLWLKTPNRYLVDIVDAGHTALDATGGDVNPEPGTVWSVLAGPDALLAREYMKALSLAFMATYVGDRPAYQAYLSSAYALAISRPPLQLNLVTSLTPEQIQQAYGGSPPVPFFPDPVPTVVAGR